MKATTPLTLPPMTVQMGLTVMLLFIDSTVALPWRIAGLVTLLAIWGTTFGFHVPLHLKMKNQRNLRWINQQVRMNWIRTVLWTTFALGITRLMWLRYL